MSEGSEVSTQAESRKREVTNRMIVEWVLMGAFLRVREAEEKFCK